MGEINKVPKPEILVAAGDFNGHIGKDTGSFENIHGGKGYDHRNSNSTRILDMYVQSVTSESFGKNDKRLRTKRIIQKQKEWSNLLFIIHRN